MNLLMLYDLTLTTYGTDRTQKTSWMLYWKNGNKILAHTGEKAQNRKNFSDIMPTDSHNMIKLKTLKCLLRQ